MFRETLNQLIEQVSQAQDSEILFEAKKEYQELTGPIFEDDKSYESRMGSFLEWFTLQRVLPHSEKTPLIKHLEDHKDALNLEMLEIAENISTCIHSLFILKKVRPKQVVILELMSKEKYIVEEDQGSMFFNQNDIFEGRLIYYKDKYYLTDHFCYHPQQVLGYIKAKIKTLMSEENKNEKILKEMNTVKDQLMKKQSVAVSKIEKLNTKIENTNKDKKKFALNEELTTWQDKKSDLDKQIEEKIENIRDWTQEKIEIGAKRDRFNLLRRLSYMSLMWERSRQIDIKDIYSD